VLQRALVVARRLRRMRLRRDDGRARLRLLTVGARRAAPCGGAYASPLRRGGARA
jgi:hypothetical protein